MKPSPCFECEKHSATCRPGCPDYKAWRKERQNEFEKREQEKKRNRILNGYQSREIEKAKKHADRSKRR